MPTYRYRCVNGHTFEEFRKLQSQRDDPASCPGCGESAENTYIPWQGAFNAWTLGQYGVHGGYHDPALGCFIKSEEHRKAVCAAKGVVPLDLPKADANLWFEGEIRKQRDADDRKAAEEVAYKDRLAHAPEFSEWRRAEASGAFDDVLKPPQPTETFTVPAVMSTLPVPRSP